MDDSRDAQAGRSRAATLAAWAGMLAAEMAWSFSSDPPRTRWDVGLEAGLVSALALLAAFGPVPRALASPVVPVLLLVSAALGDAYVYNLWAPGAWIWAIGLTVLLARVLEAPTARWPWTTAIAGLLIAAPASRYIVLRGLEIPEPVDAMKLQLARLAPGGGEPDHHAAGRPPIVLLTIDTLRSDAATRMSSYQRLTARGASWDHAMATSSWTLPSVASILTGEMPAVHGAQFRDGKYWRILTEIPTLPERLGEVGYQTTAIVVNPFLSTGSGMSRGFETWHNPDDLPPQPFALVGRDPRDRRDSEGLIDLANDWLADAPEDGWFLWIHLFDPHIPYMDLPPDSPIAGITFGPDLDRLDPSVRPLVASAYAHDVEYTDGQVNRLIDALEARDFFKNGTLVFTVDHGEELWEHGGVEHGHSHHAEVVDVPMVVISPGVAPGPRPGVPSLVDVTPTLIAVARTDPARSSTTTPGLDLRTFDAPDRVSAATGVLYGPERASARDLNGRVLVAWTGGAQSDKPEPAGGWPPVKCAAERYDLTTDPGELQPQPVTADDPLLLAALAAHHKPESAEQVSVTAGQLEALGYTDDGGTMSTKSDAADCATAPAAPPPAGIAPAP